MTKATILIVEDNIDLCQTLADVLKKEGYRVKTAFSGEAALATLSEELIDLVLLDIKLPKMSGLEILSKIRDRDPEMLVIMITALTDAQPAVEAMKAGAYDYLLKPFELEELRLVVHKALETHQLKREVTRLKGQQKSQFPDSELFGTSTQIQELQRLIQIVAKTPKTSVLIQGESGTGKELVANAIHKAGARAEKALIKLNCAAIPGNLIESELFGHEKGAFTDAKTMKKGLFELAHEGTIFLDEISSMEISLQPKLLRVLETGSFRRIGGMSDITINVRIIAATNQNLEECVKRGDFREDLFYRLKVMVIDIPPLREHPQDIILLAKLFIEAKNKELNKNVQSISPEAEQLLIQYPWPGNVRELKNVLERAIILCNSNSITPELLHLNRRPNSIHLVTERGHTPLETASEPESLEEIEKQHILRILKKYNNNKSKAARVMSVSRSTLREKLKSYGVM